MVHERWFASLRSPITQITRDPAGKQITSGSGGANVYRYTYDPRLALQRSAMFDAMICEIGYISLPGARRIFEPVSMDISSLWDEELCSRSTPLQIVPDSRRIVCIQVITAKAVIS